MKKELILVVLIFSAINCFSIWNEIEQNANEPLFDHTSYGKESTTINFSLTGYDQETITIDDNEYQKISVWNEGDFVEVGKPDLPFFTRLITIPNSGTPHLEILGYEEKTISNLLVYPRQQLKSESQPNRNDFIIDADFYATGSTFPASFCNLGDPAIMRNLRIVAVTINPFQYDPVSRELKIYTNIDLVVNCTGSGGENIKRETTKISRAFEPIYKSTILNYESTVSRDLIYQEPNYLFIHTNDTSIEAALSYLADWKHQKGFEVITHGVNSGTSFNTIKAYIQTAYDTWENPPEFVCLVGDAAGSYNIPSGYSSGEGDQGYTLLDGTDILADVLIGRLSIENLTQLQTIIYKILYYEKQPYMGQTNWYTKILLVGDPSSSGTSCIDTKQHIKQIMTVYDPNYTFHEVYSGSFSSQMSSYINSGVSYFNYRGYMNMSGFGNTQINALTNGFMLPVTTFPTCASGSFVSGTAVSETFLRVGSPGSPKGAIAAFGTATTGTHTCFNNCVDAGTYYGLFVDHIFNMGSALNRGKIALYMNYNQNQPGYVTNFSYWNNLMGDPGMEVWTGVPQAIVVNYETQVALGTNNLVVTVQDDTGQPLPGAWVTALMGDDDIFVTGFTDENGEIILEIDAQTTGNASLTVTKHDCIPHLGSFDVGAVARFVNVFEYEIDDDNLGDSSGNNDGQINPGEVIEFNVSLKNSGTSTASGVSATLSCDNDFITITDNSEDYGNIAPGSSVYSSEDFDFAVDADVLGGTEILFELLIADNLGNLWTDYISIPVEGANLYVTNFTFPGLPNGILEPGASGNMVLTLENSGSVGTNDIFGHLSTDNELIAINDNEGFFGNINAGGNGSNPVNTFNISASNQIIPGAQIIMFMQLYNADGYDNTFSFNIEIGSVDSTDPLGPDAYGYYCFDYTDATYSSSPVYDWIEINSVGTALPLNDNGQTGDIADINNLPFIFQFYGVIYTSMTVCTNGWIAPGDTDNTSFMNWQIPGPQGPQPMIAAFWDDLKTGTVYYYYDSALHLFIIEWDNMQNQHVPVEETFQIIIYDSGFYPTATGDNEIKVQYQVFNNVDVGSYPSNHGQYCTIGIEDQTATRGLEYTYNNNYPSAAAVLGNDTAIKFTTLGGGTQNPPEMVLSQTSFDFIVLPEATESQTLQITNNGEANLVYSFSKNYQLNLAQITRNNGGPDDYGYLWFDSDETYGPVYSWRDITGLGTEVTFTHNDQGTALMPIGFDFNFYGENYSQFRINPNGWIGFGDDNTEWSNTTIPDINAPRPAIMPFWDDLNPLEGGNVYYYSTSDSLVVWFDDVIHYVGTYNGTYDFQVIIYNSGEMLFQYRVVSGDTDSATIGIQNATAGDGLQICYNSAYVQNGLAVKIIKTDDWLDVEPTSGFVTQGETTVITLSACAEDMEIGQYSCDLILNTNDPNASTVTIPVDLMVSGSFPTIVLSEDSFDFGIVNIGEEVTDTLIVSNLGNEILQVSNIEISLPEFTVSMTNFIVDPGESEELYITFAPLTAASCVANMSISSNDPINPVVEVELIGNYQFPIIQLSEYSFDFGNVNIGDEVTDTLTVYNLGNDILNVSNVETTLPVFTVSMTNFIVDPDGSEELYITFSPSEMTTYNDVLTIYSNDPENPQIEVDLTGCYQAPIIDVSAASIDFGGVVLGELSSETLVVSNLGNAVLHVSEVELVSAVFSTDLDDFSVAPGEAQDLVITYEPDDTEPDFATLILHSDDPENPEVEVELSGESLYPICQILPVLINFGEVDLGETITDTIYIQNTGTADLDVTSIYTVLNVFDVSVNALVISPATTEEIYVTFSPIDEMVYTDSVWIIAETPFGSIFEVSLLGQGVIPVNANDILPLITEVFQNYPNPFNPSTTIKYAVAKAADVSIVIYNIKGEKVKTLVRAFQEPHFYQAVWNGKDDANKPVASGVYFYVSRIGDYKAYNKMLVIK
ncbi:MAG: C25 family cysteine peptidase [Candidatus Cloacimonadales bacterium]|nr:C25 family cysteine peptidase [Candidatus Cloacimonadales bacterium]